MSISRIFTVITIPLIPTIPIHSLRYHVTYPYLPYPLRIPKTDLVIDFILNYPRRIWCFQNSTVWLIVPGLRSSAVDMTIDDRPRYDRLR
jgi:hypothetical protein